jgi:hypothetical protein
VIGNVMYLPIQGTTIVALKADAEPNCGRST